MCSLFTKIILFLVNVYFKKMVCPPWGPSVTSSRAVAPLTSPTRPLTIKFLTFYSSTFYTFHNTKTPTIDFYKVFDKSCIS